MNVQSFTDPRTGRRTAGDPSLRQRDQNLEALKAVAGKLAHDFNNFLAPQYGYITLLKDEIASSTTPAGYVSAMESSALKAEAYIASILIGMRPHRQFSPREFDLGKTLQEGIEKWRSESATDSGVQVRANIEPALFWGDEKQWRIVLEQLLSNAHYALAIGGELRVTLRRQILSGQEVERLGLATNDVFHLEIRDNGFGMNPEVARRAFEPFFTTRTQVRAPGLGLTIVHGITLYHGGQVELASAEDQGTTITLWLPATRLPYGEKDERHSINRPVAKRQKVLLIEDDPLIREVLRGWLANHDLETEMATNEKEARRSLARSGDLCVLVLCEADLKAGRGEDLYAALRDINSSARWVFLSRHRQIEIPRAEPAHEPLVIKKPFSHTAFSELIGNYIRRS